MNMEEREDFSATSFRQVTHAVPAADPRPMEDDCLDDCIKNNGLWVIFTYEY